MNKIGKLLCVNTVSTRLNCSKQRVYNLIDSGELQIIRLGPRGIRIAEDELEKFIEERKVKNNNYCK